MLYFGKGKNTKPPQKPTQTLNTSLYPAASHVDDCLFGMHCRANTENFIQESFGWVFFFNAGITERKFVLGITVEIQAGKRWPSSSHITADSHTADNESRTAQGTLFSKSTHAAGSTTLQNVLHIKQNTNGL